MKRLLIALVAACVAVSGCGSGSPATPSAQSGAHSTQTSTTPLASLLGTYATTITGKEHFHFRGADQLTPGSPSTGKWKLTLTPVSVTYTHLPDRFHVTYKAVYGDGRMTVAASKGCDFNLVPETKGLYTYRLVDGQLSFREIHDSCLDRAGLLTGEPWHRQ